MWAHVPRDAAHKGALGRIRTLWRGVGVCHAPCNLTFNGKWSLHTANHARHRWHLHTGWSVADIAQGMVTATSSCLSLADLSSPAECRQAR